MKCKRTLLAALACWVLRPVQCCGVGAGCQEGRRMREQECVPHEHRGEHFTWVPKAQVSLLWRIAGSWAGLVIRNKCGLCFP